MALEVGQTHREGTVRNDTDITADVKETIGTVEMCRKCETYLFKLEDQARRLLGHVEHAHGHTWRCGTRKKRLETRRDTSGYA